MQSPYTCAELRPRRAYSSTEQAGLPTLPGQGQLEGRSQGWYSPPPVSNPTQQRRRWPTPGHRRHYMIERPSIGPAGLAYRPKTWYVPFHLCTGAGCLSLAPSRRRKHCVFQTTEKQPARVLPAQACPAASCPASQPDSPPAGRTILARYRMQAAAAAGRTAMCNRLTSQSTMPACTGICRPAAQGTSAACDT